MFVFRKVLLCDSFSHLDSDEKYTGMDFRQSGQELPLPAAHVEPYIALAMSAIRLQPVVDRNRDFALERINMPANAFAHIGVKLEYSGSAHQLLF